MNEHVSRLVARNSDVRTGARYGRLRVLGMPFWYLGETRWRTASVVCECSCGEVCVAEVPKLTTGRIRSCGCLRGSLARTAR